MLRLLGIVISIGLADSLNPTTIAPALYLGSHEHGRRRVLEFTMAVFAVYLLGGIVIALGPGRLLISLIPHPHHRIAYIIELIVGVAMVAGSMLLWRHRHRLAERDPPEFDANGRSSWVLGATITAIELPSAFPYFAAIAAVVGGDVSVVEELVLLVVFNLCFVVPLLGICGVLTFAGERAQRMLVRGRTFLQAHWPRLLAAVGIAAGLFVILLGATGVASAPHGHVARMIRRLRRRFIPH